MTAGGVREKKWLRLAEAAKFYDISKSSMERWLYRHPEFFTTRKLNGERFVNVEESRVPTTARPKAAVAPPGYLTLSQALAYYRVRRTTLHTWARAGHVCKRRIGRYTYIDPARSNPPGPPGAEAAPTTPAPEAPEKLPQVPEMWRKASVAGYRVSSEGRIMGPEGEVLPTGVASHAVQLGPGQRARLVVRREVARAFLSRYREDAEVEHLNGDETDNRAENLRVRVPPHIRNQVRVRVTWPRDGKAVVYESLLDAARATGHNKNSIWYASRFHTKLGGLRWERV